MTRRVLHILEFVITIAQMVIISIFCVAQKSFGFRELIKKSLSDSIVVSGIDQNTAGIFLQVDATILTLTIALIAIIGGLVSESHMGISYSHYYLNLRPKYYKQIWIILLSMGYFLFACVSFWLGWNYMVAAMLFCEILLVVMSATTIYGVFSGNDKIKKEITEYSIESQIGAKEKKQKDKGKNKKKDKKKRRVEKGKEGQKEKTKDSKSLDSQKAFIEAFSSVLSTGKRDQFEDYRKVLEIIVEYSWKNRNNTDSNYSLKELEKNINTLLDSCAASAEYNSKLFYLNLVNRVYELIESFIRDEKGEEQGKSGVYNSFNIVSNYTFGYEILRFVDVEDFEDIITISDLAYRINLVDFILHNDYKEKSRWISRRNINDLYSQFGFYLKLQHKKGNAPNLSYWGNVFYSWYWMDNVNYLDYLADDSNHSFADAMAYAGINYACGLIIQGQFDIVKNGLYAGRMDALPDLNYIEKKIILSVHSYLYYMAWRENEESVGEDLKQYAKQFVSDSNVASSFRDFLATNEIDDILIDNISSEWIYDEDNKERTHNIKNHELNNVLRTFDLRMGDKHFHRIIISEVIDDFCVFTLFYLNIHGMSELKWLGDENHNIADYISYISDNGRNRINGYDEYEVKERVRAYINFLYADRIDTTDPTEKEKIDREANGVYELLVTSIKDRYKNNCIKKAREKEADYLKNIENLEVKKQDWTTSVVDEIKNRFGTLINFDSDNEIEYVNVELFKYLTFTDMISDKLNHSEMSRIISQLMDFYIRMMDKAGIAVFKDKKRDFSDDQIYVNYLRENNLQLFIGSEYLLKNSDYQKTELFTEETKNSVWVTSFGGFYGAVLKKGSVAFYIKDIKATVSNATANDFGTPKISGEVLYEPTLGVKIDFEKEEFNDYISKERKIVEITAKIGIKAYVEDAGIYFKKPMF